MILVVSALAVYRLARLVVYDTITEQPRKWISERSDWADSLVNCVWCVGFWISLTVTFALWFTSAVTLPAVGWVLLPFALSAIAGIIDSWV